MPDSITQLPGEGTMAFFETVSLEAHLPPDSEQTLFSEEEKKAMRTTERDGLSSYLRGLGGHIYTVEVGALLLAP